MWGWLQAFSFRPSATVVQQKEEPEVKMTILPRDSRQPYRFLEWAKNTPSERQENKERK